MSGNLKHIAPFFVLSGQNARSVAQGVHTEKGGNPF
jgi:hypothetical protein